MIQFVIGIEPVAKGRPRLGKYRTYTPEKTRQFETELKQKFIKLYKAPPLLGALELIICFYLKRPSSISEKKRPYPTVCPDLDNYLKAFLDAGNGIIYKDDAQVVRLMASKAYAPQGHYPRIVFQLSPIDGASIPPHT